MYYLEINGSLIYASARLLDCTDEAEEYMIDDSDSVIIYDDVGPLLRMAKSHEVPAFDEWPWKECLRLVVNNDSSN